MSSSSKKLWQTLFVGIVLANSNAMSVFGQSLQPGSSAELPPAVPPVAVQQPDGTPTAGPQPAQSQALEQAAPMPGGYLPCNGCPQCASPPSCQSAAPPMCHCGPSYGPFGGWTARVKRGFARCCSSGKSHRWTETECDCPAIPLGASLAEHRHVLRAEAQNVGMVLYRYDFVDGSDQLNRKGRERLAELGPLLATTVSPLTIEDVPEDPTLAALRRQRVLLDLQQRPFNVAPERVIVRSADWPQLRGEEAELARRRLLKQTTNGGPGTGSIRSAR